MSDSFAKRGVLPLKVSCNQVITVNSSKFNDFKFNKKIITKQNSYRWNALAYDFFWVCWEADENSGLDMLMKAEFAGVDKMFIRFPMNIRAL